MNFKTTYVLFGALAALIGVLAIVLWRGQAPTSTGLYVLSSMHDKANPMGADDVDRVEIEVRRPESPRIVFERNPGAENAKDKEWRITSPRSLRGDPGNIRGLVAQLYDLELEKDRKPENFKVAGLESPQRIITLKKGDRAVTLSIGDATAGTTDAVVYVTSSDRPKEAMAVRKSSLAAALEGLNYFRSRDLLGDSPADVKVVKLVETKGANKREVELKKESDGWWVVKPRRVDAARFDEKLRHLSGLKVAYTDEKNNDFVQDDVTDLAKFKDGVLDPAKGPVLRIEVTRTADGQTTTRTLAIGVGKKLDDKAKAAGKDEKKDEKKEGKYYAYLAGGKSRDVVRVPASEVEPFLEVLKGPDSLRAKDLVKLAREPDAIVIEHHLDKKKLELLRTDVSQPWQMYQGATGEPAYEPEMQKLISLLMRKDQVQQFVDVPPKDATPEITVRVYEGSQTKAEKKGGKSIFKEGAKPAAVLRFPRRDRSVASVLVEREWGGNKAWARVPKELFEQLDKGPLAYHDRTMPKFAADDNLDNATELVLKRGEKTYKLVRAKSDAPWKIEQPADLKGREASGDTVSAILNSLNGLRATDVVALKASESDLKGYNLFDPPYQAKVTVTKNGKGTTTTYSFSGKVGDKRAVNARVSGHDAIYVVDDAVLTQLGKELRNTRVFAFDPRDVEQIKLTGYYNPLRGGAQTQTLTRKGDGWAFKEFKVAVKNDEVSSLLRALSSLEARAFVEGGKGEKMTAAENALTIELSLKDKKSLKLTLGGETEKGMGLDKEPVYFATSPQMGSDAFLVSRGPFATVRGGEFGLVATKK